MKIPHALFTIILFTCSFCAQAAFAWAPLKETEVEPKHLKKLMQGKPLTYTIEYKGNVNRSLAPDVEKAFDDWFSNVLSYRRSVLMRKAYPDFSRHFSDIEHMAAAKNKLTPHTKDSAYGPDIKFVFTSQKLPVTSGRMSLLQKMMAITAGLYDRGYSSKNISATISIYIPDNREHLKTVGGRNGIQMTTSHEIGHVFGLGDLGKYSMANTNLKHPLASGEKNALMNNSGYFTCDDADALVNIIDIRRARHRNFASFCNNGSGYIDGRYTENYAGDLKKFNLKKDNIRKNTQSYVERIFEARQGPPGKKDI
ncbi:hypothetical protein Dip510_000626 [Elusimicrobium posterum]|uniref:hypothetical protein n=1 Tax=Elusimicrobium posterum TaxID=3116653 RepID=UPI003C7271FA